MFPLFERRLLFTIFALSVCLRLASAFYQGNTIEPLPGVHDQVSYDALARRVADGQGFTFATNWWPATRAGEPTAHWSYLYTLFLAFVYKLFAGNVLAARLIQAVVAGVLHPLLAWRLGCRMGGSDAGIAAAFVAAVYSYFVYYGGALMTETFYIVAVLWVLDCTLLVAADANPSRLLWFRLGAATACAVLLRQVFLLAVPFLFGWLLWTAVSRNRQSVRQSLRGLGVAVATLVLAIVPWTIRNQIAFGTFSLLNSSAGFAFYWANHPVHGERFVPILPENGPSYFDLLPPEVLPLNEAQMERSLMQRALQDAAAHPGRIARLSLSRFSEYFRFWPSGAAVNGNDLVRLASFGMLFPLALAGMVIAYRRARRSTGAVAPARLGLEVFLLFCILYTVIHLLSWTLIRYRLPVDAVLVIFAAVGAAAIVRRLSTWRARYRGTQPTESVPVVLAGGPEWRTR
jgi:4-amino-4-deoxy-L-arabinose transferase-like glycosyltransferase